MTPIAIAPTVRLGGSPLSTAWEQALIECRVELPVRAPNRVTLRFVDPGYTLATSGQVTLGAPLTVSVPPTPGNDSSVVLAEVEVTAIGVEQEEGEQPELVLTAMDKSHRMARGTVIKTYLTQTYSDIVTQIADKYGLTAKATSTSEAFDYVLQVDCDMGMLSEMASRAGFDWYVVAGTLHFAPPSLDEPVVMQLGAELRNFSVRTGGHHPGSVEVYGWDRDKQQQIVGTASSPTLVLDSDLAKLGKEPDSAFGEAKLATAALAAGSDAEAERLSQALLDISAAAAVRAHGLSDIDGRLRPGRAVRVEDSGPLSGNYPITRVEHSYRARRGFISRFWSGERLGDTAGTGIANRQGLLLGAGTHHPGLVVGEVTNINDPNQAGRVKVRFPGLDEHTESSWARIVSQGGGPSRGNVAIPLVGDEVLVGFEHGDPRQPVVLGGLYGGKNAIPKWTVEDGEVTAWRTTSRLGHITEFGDGTDNKDQYYMVQLAGAEQTLSMSKVATKLEVASGNPVTIKAGGTQIEFSSSGDITMKAPNITIQAEQALKLSGLKIQVSANTELQLQGNTTTSLKGGATLQMEGGATASLKGGIVQIN